MGSAFLAGKGKEANDGEWSCGTGAGYKLGRGSSRPDGCRRFGFENNFYLTSWNSGRANAYNNSSVALVWFSSHYIKGGSEVPQSSWLQVTVGKWV